MDNDTRKKELKKISEGEAAQTGLNLFYHGESHTFKAYRVPLDLLVYNKYNGRISSQVKSFEHDQRPLNPEDPEDVKIIEKFLLESNEGKNKDTRKDIREKGQRLYGVVTNEGVIIDGNRRASILKSLYNDQSIKFDERTRFSHFMAIILPENVDYKDILYLETSIQLGEDEKVGYDPIAKYLKARDMILAGLTTKDVSTAMSISEKTAKEYLEVLALMDDYLDYLGYDGLYTTLSGTEDQFLQLRNWIDTYSKGCTNADWAYGEEDISDLKRICFDYIRARYEGKDYRNIGVAGKGTTTSIFKIEGVWVPFRDNHYKMVSPISEKEGTVEQYREQFPNKDISKVLNGRDKDWATKVSGDLASNLKEGVDMVDNIRSDNPVRQISKAILILNTIDPESKKFKTQEARNLLGDLLRRVNFLLEQNSGEK